MLPNQTRRRDAPNDTGRSAPPDLSSAGAIVTPIQR
jgi:hypothetical protein